MRVSLVLVERLVVVGVAPGRVAQGAHEHDGLTLVAILLAKYARSDEHVEQRRELILAIHGSRDAEHEARGNPQERLGKLLAADAMHFIDDDEAESGETVAEVALEHGLDHA